MSVRFLLAAILAAQAAMAAASADIRDNRATPDEIDFGPFELASPLREARVKIGPDEPPAVRKAVAEMLAEVEAKTSVKIKYSTWS